MTDIFISYAREDRDRVRLLAEALEEQGWSVWWDTRIVAGQTFDRVIEQALEAAGCVIVLWSAHSIESDWVKSEAAEGNRRGVLIPALLEEVRIPLEFRRKQTVSLAGWRGEISHPGFQELCRAVAATLGRPAAAPEKPPAARPRLTPLRKAWVFGALAVLAAGGGIVAVVQERSRTPDAQVSSPAPLVVRIKTDGGFSSHGFFTPKGYIVAATHAVAHTRQVTVAWEEGGTVRDEKAEVIRKGALQPEATLLKPGELRSRNVAIRVGGSLKPGDKIERYLGPNDRTPGQVIQVFAQKEVVAEGGRKTRLDRLLLTTQVAGPGDSGSPIVDAEGRVVAMLYGASPTETVALLIEDIKVSFPEAF